MYEAIMYGEKYDSKDIFFGEFHTELDAMNVCERHAETPLLWRIYSPHDPDYSAKCGKCLYVVRSVAESEAAE